ncbi:MAG TPA: hypothetical protein VK993_00185 [Chthoniobacterales bacterium]|nr:hypothetical protein [Chthoniobacterales bacterium]
MNILKFAIPLAAIFSFSVLAPLAAASTPKRSSSQSKSKSSSSTRKKSASSKKSSKTSKSSSRKRKSSKAASKSKAKSERRTAKAAEPQNWIDELPEVELPEAAGPAEGELLDPVAENEEP